MRRIVLPLATPALGHHYLENVNARGYVEAVDAFGSPPLVTLEDTELSVTGDPGWARSIATALRGMRVSGVRSRPGDRVVAIDFGTTSRFGVTAAANLAKSVEGARVTSRRLRSQILCSSR